jgi:hypothetical protein
MNVSSHSILSDRYVCTHTEQKSSEIRLCVFVHFVRGEKDRALVQFPNIRCMGYFDRVALT